MHDFSSKPSRRQALATVAACGGALLLGKPRSLLAAASTGPLRIAHLTDIHIQPELGAADGYAAALQSLQKLDPQPAFITTGGDHVMDMLDQDAARCKTQWDLYDNTLSQNTKLKTYPVIGNHDVWAWGKKQEATDAATAGYGKAMAMDRLKLTRSYYSFDQGGWHFVMLDNISRDGFSYAGVLDPEQTEWLKGDLSANNGKLVCVVSHIPLLCACLLPGSYKPERGGYEVAGNLLHREAQPLLRLLRDNNVKLCVSGHIHLLDTIEFLGMKFICGGAICGNWWKGPREGAPEGYSVIDLWPDGKVEHRYLAYGWTARKPQQ